MNNNSNIWLVAVVGILGMGILLIALFTKPKVNWNITYDYESIEPYGTKFIHELLKTKYEVDNYEMLNLSFDIVLTSLDSTKRYDYLNIGKSRRFNTVEVDALLQFVSNGNNVFLANERESYLLFDTLYQGVCRYWNEFDYNYDYGYDSTDEEFADLLDDLDTAEVEESLEVEIEPDTAADDDPTGYWSRYYTDEIYTDSVIVNLTDDALKSDSASQFYFFNDNDTLYSDWGYFVKYCLDENQHLEFLDLSYVNDSSLIFIGIPFGDGYFYLHSIPLFFTNVQLLQADRLEYAEKVMSYLNNDHLLWDEHVNPNDYGNFNWNGGSNDRESPLSYVLSEPSLKWSLYLIMILTLIFIAFRAKRRQQFIPVIAPNSNTSLEYVEMMGQLYYEQKNHHFIASQMWKKFMEYIKMHYYIIPKKGENDWMDKVALKSQIDKNKLQGILHAYEKTKFESIDEQELINFYQKLNYFYSNCK